MIKENLDKYAELTSLDPDTLSMEKDEEKRYISVSTKNLSII